MQFLETFECSGQISRNSCHFWNNRSIFLQILHQSSGSWNMNFYVSSRQFEVLHFDRLLLSKSCTLSAKKVQNNYLSLHWRVIQTLKKNSLFVWMMTQEIWWILTWAVNNLKICAFMGCFCQKYVSFELK